MPTDREKLREMLDEWPDMPDTASVSGLLVDLTFGALRALVLPDTEPQGDNDAEWLRQFVWHRGWENGDIGQQERDRLEAIASRLATTPIAEPIDDRLLKAVKSFERADTEFRRAKNSGEQPRLMNAGDRYQMAKWRMFDAMRAAATGGMEPTETP